MMLSAVAEAHSLPTEFIPKGWEVQTTAEGDLNNDGRNDLALILRGTDLQLVEDSGDITVGVPWVDPRDGSLRFVLDKNPRQVLICLARPDGGYQLVARNHQLLPAPYYPGGDPLDGFDINAGKLSMGLIYSDRRHGELYSAIRFHFEFQNGRLVLSQAERTQFRRYVGNVEETREVDYVTGRVKASRFRVSDRESMGEDSATEEVEPAEFERVTPDYPLASWEPVPAAN